jgi:16S rRNA (adenine1518-N6/adenine1519-N6)-dimethyltransferase
MPPTVFWPRPKVDSAILSVRTNPEKRSRIADLEYFHQTIRSIFLHRRKFLRSALISAMKEQLDKTEVDVILSAAGFGTEARAEELTVEQLIHLVALCRNFRSHPDLL